jgi:hypothetical protein
MKTLFSFEDLGCMENFYFEVEGDYSYLNGTYFNGSDNGANLNKLTEIMYNSDRSEKITRLSAPTKDWDFFVAVGYFD